MYTNQTGEKLRNTEKIKIFCKGINARSVQDTAKEEKTMHTDLTIKKGNEILKGY